MDEILSYYEAQLLTDVVTIKEGLLRKTAIPLASRQTSFTVFHAISVPMPQYEKDKAIMWKTEAPYLAISEDNMKTTVLTEYNLKHCLGSSRNQICHEMIPTETGHRSCQATILFSCQATIFFEGNLDTLKVCDTEQIQLPSTKNLGFGVWLITSAISAYTLFESDIESTTASGIEKLPGCHICIVTLECGKQLVEPNIKIRSGLATCEQLPAIKTNVQLLDPISNLLSELPELEDMPYYDTKTEAGIELFKEVEKKLLQIPKVQNQEETRKIAKPLALNMRKLRPSLARVFDDRLTLKNSLIMSIISFIGSMVLHALFMWIYHKCKKEKTDPMQLSAHPLTQESNTDPSEPTAPFQEALNDVEDHASRIKLEMTMDLNNVRAHAFTSQTSYINWDVSKSQPGLHSMNQNIVQLKEH